MSIHFDLFAFRGSIFVETGTGIGSSVITAMRLQFPQIHSIDISDKMTEIANIAVENEAASTPTRSKVTLYTGDSEDILPSICEKIRYQYGQKRSEHTAFVTFWLDASPIQMPEGQVIMGKTHWPVLEELKIIGNFFKGALKPPVILINRLSLMSQPDGFYGHDVTLEKVAKVIYKMHPSYTYQVLQGEYGENDVLAAIPSWLIAASSWP